MSEIKTNKISSLDSSNSDITLDPDGTGDVVVASGHDLTVDTNTLFVDAANNRVGIGTASPAVVADIKSSGATSTALRVLRSDATANLHALTEISGHGRLSIYDGSENEDVRLDSNGISFLSGGLTFDGSTTAANALDDYEEGTWSPAIDNLTYGSSNDYVMIGAGALTEVQSIPYTKIGRMVFIYGTIRFKATHNLRFAMSLPVTHSGSDYGMAGSVGGFGMPNGGSLGFLGGSGDRVDLFTISDTDGGHGNISVTSGDEIYFNFHYQAA